MNLEGFSRSLLVKVCWQTCWVLGVGGNHERQSLVKGWHATDVTLYYSVFSFFPPGPPQVMHTLMLCQYRRQMPRKATMWWSNEITKLYHWLSLWVFLIFIINMASLTLFMFTCESQDYYHLLEGLKYYVKWFCMWCNWHEESLQPVALVCCS